MKSQTTFLMLLMLGLCFLNGYGFSFGFGEGEPTKITIPQSDLAGWLCITTALLWTIPPWTLQKLIKLIKRIVKGHEIDKSLIISRITKEESDVNRNH